MNGTPIIPYSDLEWFLLTVPNDGDPPPPPAKPDFHWHVIMLLVSALRRYQHAHGLDWYLGVESAVTVPHQLSPREVNPGPDVLMAEADDHERCSWNVEEEGALPLFVLEVVTRESWTRDTGYKPVLYDRMGVREYLIFAPEHEEPGPRFFGYHRDAEGKWGAWEAEADGELRSDVFGGLRFFEDKNRLRVRDVEGRILLSDEEVAAQETARADAAEAELRRLKARYGIAEE
ncbi:MAG: Uma2 family endonuclease [Chloroflexota bacterium]